MKFTFGSDLVITKVVNVDINEDVELTLPKSQQLEFRYRGKDPVILSFTDGENIWYAQTMLPNDANKVLEVVVPRSGNYLLDVKVLTEKDFIGTSKDKQEANG